MFLLGAGGGLGLGRGLGVLVRLGDGGGVGGEGRRETPKCGGKQNRRWREQRIGQRMRKVCGGGKEVIGKGGVRGGGGGVAVVIQKNGGMCGGVWGSSGQKQPAELEKHKKY